MYLSRPSGRPFTPVSRDVVSPALREEFQWNLAEIFINWVGIAVKVSKVKGQEVKVIARPTALLRRRIIHVDGGRDVNVHLCLQEQND